MLTTTAAYLSVTRNLARQQAATASDPQVKSETAYFRANIGKVKTIADLVGNYRLFSYAMKAFGMEDMTYAKGLVTKILQGGTSDPKALANTLSDPRYLALAKAFDFAGKGTAATQDPALATNVTARYVEQSLEDKQGQSNEGVQLALYFARNAGSITNVYGLLADKTMLKVVQTAYGLPTSATADIDSQAATLKKLLPIADLKDPAKVQKIAQRFTAMYDLTGANASSASAGVAQIFARSSTTVGFGADLLLGLQNLKLGGS